jgi:hypothetical protein
LEDPAVNPADPVSVVGSNWMCSVLQTAGQQLDYTGLVKIMGSYRNLFLYYKKLIFQFRNSALFLFFGRRKRYGQIYS